MEHSVAVGFFDMPEQVEFWIDAALLGLSAVVMAFTCLRLILSKSLLGSIVLMSVFSLLIGLCYLFLDAPDVAMTETALGACLSTCVLLNIVKVVGEETGNVKRLRMVFASVLCIAFFIMLTWVSFDLPEFGASDSPLQQHVSKYYIEHTRKDIGIPSIVAAILASYRGFDTLGEAAVILVAGLSVLLILNRRRYTDVMLEEMRMSKNNLQEANVKKS